jgi:hypothetical protein
MLEEKIGDGMAMLAGEADGSGLGPCLMAGFGSGGIEHSQSVN